MPSPESATAKRILVRATNWIGDSVISMPAIQRLRELEPHAHIVLLCHTKLAALWKRNPYLDEVITFIDAVDISALRDREFDAAIILPNSFRSAWECRRAGIPHRIGYRGHKRRLLLTDVVPEPAGEESTSKEIEVAGKKFPIKQFSTVRHQVHRYLDIIGFLGGSAAYCPPKIYLAHEELPPLTKFFHDDGRPCFGLNAGGEFSPAKRWPPAQFAEVARRVVEHCDGRWILFGGPGDIPIANEIETALRNANVTTDSVINLAGKTTLLELFLLLKICAVFLTNDTGPMHVAAALDVPVVAIFGSTSAELTGPLNKRSIIIQEKVECNPCFLGECPIDFRCMQRISLDKVTAAVLKQIEE